MRPSRLVTVPSPLFFFEDPTLRSRPRDAEGQTMLGDTVASVTVAVVFVIVAIEVVVVAFVS